MTNDESLSSTPPARRTWRQRIPFALLMVFTAVYALATAVSAWRTFTPVPIWDMWAAALEFYIDVHRGVGWDAWWRQVNEHRLVLPKALFWMEYTWFGGQQVFLIIMNYVLVGCGLAVFVVFLRARLPAMSGRSRFFGATLLALWLFSWVQKENLAWANQGQFFLAQLLPLAGFYCLYRAACAPSARGWFPAACTIGVLSVGTMANGVMALPMMVLYAAVTRLGWRRTAILAVLAAVCAGAYAVGYTSPSDHGGVFSKLRDRPLDMLSYILVYLGSPFQHFVLKQHSPSWTPLSQAFGVLFVLLSLAPLPRALRDPRAHRLDLALLTFVAYIGGLAFATSGGRVHFGLESALSSRYTTPTVMAWAALAILYAPRLVALRGAARVVMHVLLIALLAQMLVVQMSDTGRKAEQHMRMTGALALQMGVHDTRRIGMLIWNEQYGARLVRGATAIGAGVFGRPALVDATHALGEKAEAVPARCHAFVDQVETLPGEPRFVRVQGGLLPEPGRTPFEAVRLVGADGTVVGYGLPDRWRKRTPPAHAPGPFGRYLMFTAYLQVPASGQLPPAVTLQAPGTPCSAALVLAPPVPAS
ncbi:hypothetical protein QRO11_22815 [Paracidovorax citrulli]|uniref:Uncharacterized protein n=2 Tax=Paracidovorax citrulli TaxID=80869 RepID=A1TI88_PARC0|nr:hypothetical protein [Paracidovorax citrulli]ABM30676.1 conserved hypothetical protein [Paracidovorax citrulli AAC00-1]ATG96127.1 hypothetical protein CQB05_20555 [Paracidovorax citrulli]PVY64843.1 hypothetical protein C8E08_2186 [Paracidovorax citrulli]QCX10745.1 hypothetical protein APS58_1895 [Paracidovorax citrulli]REG70961.1 hypothetical protein C8E07_4185 [Paracidovorax citrulli]